MNASELILPTVRRIARLALNVRDLERSTNFYERALGFAVTLQAPHGARLALGKQEIELVRQPSGRPYPTPRAANDPWFQHFAIAVADMDAAYGRLSHYGVEPITSGGPQLLPPSTGSVTAYKFRDPDGHPLELSFAPASAWARIRASNHESLFLGIDHTAIAVNNLEASIGFYEDLGFRLGSRLVNRGPEQARLDGLTAPVVDIVTLLTRDAGPHVELLHYRLPTPAPASAIAPNDIAATRTVLAPLTSDAAALDARLTDPDGHLLRFTPS